MAFSAIISLWKLLKNKPSLKKSWGIGQFGRNQLRIPTGLVTGHCHIKAHLFKLGPVNSPSMTDVNRHPEQPHMFLVTVKLWSL
jgi:hypothetical protein